MRRNLSPDRASARLTHAQLGASRAPAPTSEESCPIPLTPIGASIGSEQLSTLAGDFADLGNQTSNRFSRCAEAIGSG